MASNIDSFALGVERWAGEETKKAVSKMHRAVTLSMLKQVATETPVDTGRARANWQVGSQTPPTDVLDATDKSPNAAATVAREAGEIESIRPFTISYVANNLPYIGPLNDGHSQQAPSGYVDAVVERHRQQFGG